MHMETTKSTFETYPFDSEREANMRAALWDSLVEELRQKLAALKASGLVKDGEINEPLLHEFGMGANGGLISVWLHTDDGKGSWNAVTKHLDMAEPWFLSADGIFKIDGETMNLSEAADRFIAKLLGPVEVQAMALNE